MASLMGRDSCAPDTLLFVRNRVRERVSPHIGATFTHANRVRLRGALDAYLRSCYRRQSAARVSEFAETIGVTRSYISRAFRSILGATVRQEMREAQVRHAERLLRETPLSTSEVAAAAAFGTPATFFRIFIRLRGTTPDAYRHEVTK